MWESVGRYKQHETSNSVVYCFFCCCLFWCFNILQTISQYFMLFCFVVLFCFAFTLNFCLAVLFCGFVFTLLFCFDILVCFVLWFCFGDLFCFALLFGCDVLFCAIMNHTHNNSTMISCLLKKMTMEIGVKQR